MPELLYKDEVYAIVGAAMEVHRVLGCGFLEGIYQQALEIELTTRKIPYIPQKELPIYYKNVLLSKIYVADFVLDERIIVEIKALNRLTPQEDAQILNYLKATGFELGLLINFGGESLEWKRIIDSKKSFVKFAKFADKNHD
jgi:GxxExxY protein